MNAITQPTRRGFLASASAALGAFTLGFHVPLTREAAAQGAEIGRAHV